MKIVNFANKEPCLYDLFRDTLFYLIHRPIPNSYLHRYPKYIKEADKFFRRKYNQWPLNEEYHYKWFLSIQLEYHGLLDDFKKWFREKFLSSID